MTDSELVPWGKGEKKGETPSEIEPETVCGQTERAPSNRGDLVPIEEWAGELPLVVIV